MNCVKGSNGMANSVKPGKTAPERSYLYLHLLLRHVRCMSYY